MKLRLTAESYADVRPAVLAEMANEIREAEPDLDLEEAGRRAKATFERRFKAAYGLQLRDEALRIFDAARKEGAIAAKKRRTVERPEVGDLGDLAGMFRAMARRLGCDVSEPERSRTATSQLETWLGDRIAAAEVVAQQRAVRGDGWYFEAMSKWDVENVRRMHAGPDPLAPDQVNGYREDPRTGRADGLRVPLDDGGHPKRGVPIETTEQDRYYAQRLAWMRQTVLALQNAAVS